MRIPFEVASPIRAPWFRRGAALVLLLVSAAPAPAFQLTSATFSGSALDVAGGSFKLGATVAEAVVVGAVSGGSFALGGGFWASIYQTMATNTGQPPTTRWVNALRANNPNPFHRSTSIAFTLADERSVRLVVYDAAGRQVAVLVNESRKPGIHRVHWEGRDESGRSVASGIYFYRLSVGAWSETRKILKLR